MKGVGTVERAMPVGASEGSADNVLGGMGDMAGASVDTSEEVLNAAEAVCCDVFMLLCVTLHRWDASPRRLANGTMGGVGVV